MADNTPTPVPAPAPTYSIRIKGETNTFEIAAWQGLTIDQVAPVLSDLTGYVPKYIKETIINRMYNNSPKVVEIIHAQGWNGKSVPSFLVIEDQNEVPA